MSKRRIGRIAVIGAGTMGAQIAAHFANAGFGVLLLDVPSPEATQEELAGGLSPAHSAVRNRVARLGLDRALKARPPAFFLPEFAGRIAIGNTEDDAGRLSEADWIVEAVLEDTRIKRAVLEKIDAVRKPGALVTTNTSGLSVVGMAEGRSRDFRECFLGAHFFNPPRYMRLLEVIPTPFTAPEPLEFVSDFADRVLGKGIVVCRDTPGFIGNRIGIFAVMDAVRRTMSSDLALEEVDALTGPPMGRPRSGTFRLCDIIGLDVVASVASHLHEHLPADPDRATFELPPIVRSLIDREMLGDKRGKGFYAREGREVLALDPVAMAYRPRRKTDARLDDLKALISSDTPAGRFAWGHLSAVLCYAAGRAPEIADDIVRVDDAMRWGFNWSMGPFELWDAVGVRDTADRLTREGRPLPSAVRDLLGAGQSSFYSTRRGRRRFFDLSSLGMQDIQAPSRVLHPEHRRARKKGLYQRAGGAVVDLGEGVACLELPRPFDPFHPELPGILPWAMDIAAQEFEALVVAVPPSDVSPGDEAGSLEALIAEGRWEEIDRRIRALQQAVTALRNSRVPLVAALSGRTVGLGFTLSLHACRTQASAESAVGFNDIPRGLCPLGGGIFELLRRFTLDLPQGDDPYPAVRGLFDALRTGKIATNAWEARSARFLRPGDGLTMNPDRVLADARALALEAVRIGTLPNATAAPLPVMGEPGLARLKLDLYLANQAGVLDEAGLAVGLELAALLCGGPLSGPQVVPWNYLLDLEREAFVKLCGMKG